MKKPIKFVYFDVGGVLLNFTEGHKKVAQKYGVPFETLRKVFDENWKAACKGTLSNADYMAKLAKVLPLKDPLPDITDFWTDHYLPIPETHALVHELKETYMLGIFSNAEDGAMINAFRKGLIPQAPWTATIDSSKYGTIKPEARIYEIAEQAVQVTPEEIFFIDDVEEHITVARSRGWQGMVFDTNDAAGSVQKLKKHLLRT
jgi:HAD superfamily hydrolase (TIGR01509 family)